MYKAYDLIKKPEPKLGEEEAKELIEFIEFPKGDTATKTDLQLLKIDLENKIEKAKVDILKWQFGFWLTIIGTIVAIWLSKK